eukprot:2715285-Pleurochrysis_carterae.AAC.2
MRAHSCCYEARLHRPCIDAHTLDIHACKRAGPRHMHHSSQKINQQPIIHCSSQHFPTEPSGKLCTTLSTWCGSTRAGWALRNDARDCSTVVASRSTFDDES